MIAALFVRRVGEANDGGLVAMMVAMMVAWLRNDDNMLAMTLMVKVAEHHQAVPSKLVVTLGFGLQRKVGRIHDMVEPAGVENQWLQLNVVRYVAETHGAHTLRVYKSRPQHRHEILNGLFLAA